MGGWVWRSPVPGAQIADLVGVRAQRHAWAAQRAGVASNRQRFGRQVGVVVGVGLGLVGTHIDPAARRLVPGDLVLAG